MQTPTGDFDLNLFRQRLNETILWCRYKIAQSPTHTADILWSLADPSAAPSIGKQLRSFYAPDQRIEVANIIFARRTQLIAAIPAQPNLTLDSSLMGGRLIAFFIHWTLFDGAAEFESNDFFDVDNVPACDTWVYFYNNDENYAHILSWVPPEYRHDAEQGIAVNPEQCIGWIDDTNAFWPNGYQIPYLSQLKAAGLV